MREDEMPTQSSSDDIQVDFGGTELLPDVQPLWEAMFDHQQSAGAAGLPVGDRGDSWRLRLARYERVFDRQPAFVMVARQDGEPVGYVLGYADEPFEDAEDAAPIVTIESLFVVPELRAQGLGGWLLEEAEAEAIEQWGVESSALEIMPGNALAESFTDRAGFAEIGETWLRPVLGGGEATGHEIDDDKLGELLDEGSDMFAIGLEEGPDEMWQTSEVLVAFQPEPGFAADADALESEIALFAAAGATSALVALDRETSAEWTETLTALGFRKILRLLTREIVV